MATKKKLLQAAAGSAGGAAGLNVEDIFSQQLYSGNGSNQTITNNIDLSGEGGMVWLKWVETNNYPNMVYDTERGTGKMISPDMTNHTYEESGRTGITAFNSDGFTLGSYTYENGTGVNNNIMSTTFRKAEGFFDIQTYTGNGTYMTINHNLGTTPGMVVVKTLDNQTDPDARGFHVWHRGTPTKRLLWNSTTSNAGSTRITNVNSSSVQVGIELTNNQKRYVIYLFAHNDGDGTFGPNGNEDIIKCGTYTEGSSGSINITDLGFEPQYVMLFSHSSGGNWELHSTTLGMPFTGTGGRKHFINTADYASNQSGYMRPVANGFVQPTGYYGSGSEFIYMAIRRPDQRIPEQTSDWFNIAARNYPTPFFDHTSRYVDFAMKMYDLAGYGDSHKKYMASRLMGRNHIRADVSDSMGSNSENTWNHNFGWSEDPGSTDYMSWMFTRAREVVQQATYYGTGVAKTVPHGLKVVPEMIWVKCLDQSYDWRCYHKDIGNDYAGPLNGNDAWAYQAANKWNATNPTDSVFSIGTDNDVNQYNQRFIAYLFATYPGLTKVGSYTGNGSSQSINCGFSNGARFVLIKRTDSTGDWNFYDTYRGIATGNDQRLSLNTNDAPDTSSDRIDPSSSGFTVNYVANGTSDSNISGATYIYWAIAT